jgi:hypothetical protein
MKGIGSHRRKAQKFKGFKMRASLTVLMLAAVWLMILVVTKHATISVANQDGSSVMLLAPRLSQTEKIKKSGCDSFLENVTNHPFFPKRFFEQVAMRPFLQSLQHNRDNFTDLLNARFLVFNLTDQCSVVHYHIHKNGGTTLERHVPLPTDNYYSKREKTLGHVAFEEACEKVMKSVYIKQRNQQQLHPSHLDVRTFTFLRDPVPRFLSSVAQVLKLRTWHVRLYPCYERNTTAQLLDCVLEKLEQGSFLDQHLSPQSFELYKQIMGFDISIDVMDLSEITRVVRQLGAGKVPKERSTTGSIIRRFPQFKLTSDVLTSRHINRICKIYQADVIMLKEVKIKTVCP